MCSCGAVVGCTHAADFEELLLQSLTDHCRREHSPEGASYLFSFLIVLLLTPFLGLGICLTCMVDACSQLSLLRHAIDSIRTGLEVDASTFTRISNDMVHLHKKDYVIVCFKDEALAQSVITCVVEFLQSRGLKVGSKLIDSDLFAASSSSPESPANSETAAPSEDVPMREVTPAPEASTSSAPGAPVVNEVVVDGEGDIKDELSGAPLSA